MSRALLILASNLERRQAHKWIDAAPTNTRLTFQGPKRSLAQNDRLHWLLTKVALAVEWPIGSGKKRDTEAWKDIFTAALRSARHGLDIVPGINGGFVMLGMHTASMSREECGELIDMIEAFGAEHGITFTDGEGSGAAEKTPATAA